MGDDLYTCSCGGQSFKIAAGKLTCCFCKAEYQVPLVWSPASFNGWRERNQGEIVPTPEMNGHG